MHLSAVTPPFRRIKKNVRHPQSFFKNTAACIKSLAKQRFFIHGNYVTAEVLTSYAEVLEGTWLDQ